jgi:hypothetical protein
MARRCRTATLAAVLLVAGLVAPGVGLAAAPVFERIDVDDVFVDEFLSEECGVAVTTTALGSITLRTFPGDSTGAVEVRTINVGFTATAGDRTFSIRDVGADVTRIEPDGTVVLTITGQVPFGFVGALIIDLETGEAILEPVDRSESQLAAACAALTGG